jgi:hypothetical protein
MKTQHKGIHAGLDKLGAYTLAVRRREKDFSLREMKEIMDGFGEVLWAHLDEEVRNLGAENMRKFWTLEEMNRFQM